MAWLLMTTYEGLVYFLSFLIPLSALYHFRALPLWALLGMALIGYWVAGFIFLLLLVITRCLFFTSLPTGYIELESKEGQRWFLAAMLPGILYGSPFRHKTFGFSWIAPLFFRGMGARMSDSTFLGQETIIRDPWYLEMGEHVATGSRVLFIGHTDHDKKFLLAKIIIGNHVVIGAQSTILPDVHIGNHVTIGAGSVVRRGTRIPDGETWGGVPARKLRSKESQGVE